MHKIEINWDNKENKNFLSLEELTQRYTRIPIQDVVRDKIHAYAQYARNNECYGFLLGSPLGQPGLVSEAILAPDQSATGGSARITGEVAAQAKAEIETLGYISYGFWHSHGNLSTFHSSTDDGNLNHLIFSFAGNTEESEYGPVKERGVRYKDGRIMIQMDKRIFEVTQNNPDQGYHVRPITTEDNLHPARFAYYNNEGSLLVFNGEDYITIPDVASTRMIETKGELERTNGLAYSLVVNNRREEFALIGVLGWCATCEKIEKKVKEAKVEPVFSGRKFYDVSLIKKEVEERVNNEKTNQKNRFLSSLPIVGKVFE